MPNADDLALMDMPDTEATGRSVHLAEIAQGKWSIAPSGVDPLALPTLFRHLATKLERAIVEGD